MVRTLAAFDVSWTCNGLVCNGTGVVEGPCRSRSTAAPPDPISGARELWWLTGRPGLFINIPAMPRPTSATSPSSQIREGPGLRDARDTRLARPPANARCRPG
jgi:hypothetical protein